MELGEKTVLVTGATGGLGRAITSALAQRGATLVLSGRSPEALQELSDSLPGEHRIAAADLALEGAAERLAADAGEVDCLVANAGMSGTGSLESFSTDDLTRAIRVNLEAPMVLARALAPGMVERGEGQSRGPSARGSRRSGRRSRCAAPTRARAAPGPSVAGWTAAAC